MIADSCNLMYIGKVLHGMGISRKCMQTLGLAYAWALQFQFKQSCMTDVMMANSKLYSASSPMHAVDAQ